MNHNYKGKAKYILAWPAAFILILITFYSLAVDVKHHSFHISLTADTIPVKINDTLPKKNKTDSLKAVTDTTTAEVQPGIIEEKNNAKADTSLYPVIDTFSVKF